MIVSYFDSVKAALDGFCSGLGEALSGKFDLGVGLGLGLRMRVSLAEAGRHLLDEPAGSGSVGEGMALTE